MLSCAAQGCTVLKWFQESTKHPLLCKVCTQPTANLNRNPFHSATDHLTGKGKFFCDKLQTPCTTGKPPPTNSVEYFDFFQAGVDPPPYFGHYMASFPLKIKKTYPKKTHKYTVQIIFWIEKNSSRRKLPLKCSQLDLNCSD